jgi:hypothetical protein
MREAVVMEEAHDYIASRGTLAQCGDAGIDRDGFAAAHRGRCGVSGTSSRQSVNEGLHRRFGENL